MTDIEEVPPLEQERRADDQDDAMEHAVEDGTLPEEDRRSPIVAPTAEDIAKANTHLAAHGYMIVPLPVAVEEPLISVPPTMKDEDIHKVFDRGDGTKINATGQVFQ